MVAEMQCEANQERLYDVVNQQELVVATGRSIFSIHIHAPYRLCAKLAKTTYFVLYWVSWRRMYVTVSVNEYSSQGVTMKLNDFIHIISAEFIIAKLRLFQNKISCRQNSICSLYFEHNSIEHLKKQVEWNFIFDIAITIS